MSFNESVLALSSIFCLQVYDYNDPLQLKSSAENILVLCLFSSVSILRLQVRDAGLSPALVYFQSKCLKCAEILTQWRLLFLK